MSIFKKRPDAKDETLSPAKDLVTAFEVQMHNKRKKMAKGGSVIPEVKEQEKHLPETAKITTPFQQPKKLYDEKQSEITSGKPDEAGDRTRESESDMLRRHAEEKAAHYASGGRVSDEDNFGELSYDDEGTEGSHPGSIAEAILRNRKWLATGGEVDDTDMKMMPETIESGKSLKDLDVDNSDFGEEDEKPAPKKYANGGLIPGTDTSGPIKKELYSKDENFSYSDDGEDGDSREKDSENKRDMVSKIMKKRRS